MLEMKAYYFQNDPIANSEIYITNNPKLRTILSKYSFQYQGWVLEDNGPLKESKAPTIKILCRPVAQTESRDNLEVTTEEKINVLINLLNKQGYKLFDDYNQFVRLEKFNKLPGRMFIFLVSILFLWIIWYLFISK